MRKRIMTLSVLLIPETLLAGYWLGKGELIMNYRSLLMYYFPGLFVILVNSLVMKLVSRLISHPYLPNISLFFLLLPWAFIAAANVYKAFIYIIISVPVLNLFLDFMESKRRRSLSEIV